VDPVSAEEHTVSSAPRFCSWSVALGLAVALAACGDDGLHGLPGPPVPPEAKLALRLTDPLTPSRLLVDGSGSFDPDDDRPEALAAFEFLLTEAPAGSAAALLESGELSRRVVEADRAGRYGVELVVEDSEGNRSAPAASSFYWSPLDIVGDCVTATCPAGAPYPVGCAIYMDGGDGRGCVAHAAGSSTVYLQEGKACYAGTITGALLCASEPGPALDASNCPINQPTPIYTDTPSGCPPPIDI
jgi:hypothetical protein